MQCLESCTPVAWHTSCLYDKVELFPKTDKMIEAIGHARSKVTHIAPIYAIFSNVDLNMDDQVMAQRSAPYMVQALTRNHLMSRNMSKQVAEPRQDESTPTEYLNIGE